MSRHLATWALFLVLGSSAAGACTDNTPVCIPAAALNDCICNQGERGHRVCDADGLHFGECLCGLAGTGGGSGGGGMSGGGGTSNGGDASVVTGGAASNGGATSNGGDSSAVTGGAASNGGVDGTGGLEGLGGALE